MAGISRAARAARRAAANAAEETTRSARTRRSTSVSEPGPNARLVGSSRSEPAAGRVNARTGGADRFAYEQEYGRGGRENITSGRSSYARMDEAASEGSRKRAKAYVEAERKAREGNKKAAAKVERMDEASAKADRERARKAAATRSSESRKSKGVTLAEGATGDAKRVTVGGSAQVKSSDMLIGNTENGITKMGEIIGNPTTNQISAAARNMEVRKQLSAEARRNLTMLKRLASRDTVRDMGLREMERRLVNTGRDTSPFSKGGMAKKYNKGGYANCGASMKPDGKRRK